MLELADKNFQTVIIIIFHRAKMLSWDVEIHTQKKAQIKILKIKTTISEMKK